MLQIDLSPLPNQSFSVSLDSMLFDFTIKEINGVMAASISVGGVDIISNQRITALQAIIPYQYLEQGNFTIVNMNEDLIYYTAFGITQFLIYADNDELAAIRTGS